MSLSKNYILVIVEEETVKKKKIIESILGKFIGKNSFVSEPKDTSSKVVRDWCLDNNITYSVIEDGPLDYIKWCNYGIFFAAGPTKRSFQNVYRQELGKLNKMAFVIEVNNESKSEVRKSASSRTSARAKRDKRK